MAEMNLSTEQKQAQGRREHSLVWGRARGRDGPEFGISRGKLLHGEGRTTRSDWRAQGTVVTIPQ